MGAQVERDMGRDHRELQERKGHFSGSGLLNSFQARRQCPEKRGKEKRVKADALFPILHQPRKTNKQKTQGVPATGEPSQPLCLPNSCWACGIFRHRSCSQSGSTPRWLPPVSEGHANCDARKNSLTVPII